MAYGNKTLTKRKKLKKKKLLLLNEFLLVRGEFLSLD